jgi:predicted O-methyltransferase YrrM
VVRQMSRLRTALELAVTSPSQLARAVQFRNGPPRLGNLQRLIKERKPQTIVEIGVWRGETARRMIQAAARHNRDICYWGFDLFSQGMTDEILKREVSLRPTTISEIERQLEGLGAKVTLVPGDSTETLPATELPPIDFAFVDGGHSYETVSADWRNLRPRLSLGALVVFDDYTNEAAVEHEGYGVRALIDQLKREYRVDLLRPIDDFPRPYGPLKTRLAVLRLP